MDDESIYSIIETDKVEYDEEHESIEEELDLIDELAGLKIEMMDQVISKHKWDYKEGESSIKCVYCIYYQDPEERATYTLCLRQACKACLEQKNNEKVENMLSFGPWRGVFPCFPLSSCIRGDVSTLGTLEEKPLR